MIQLYILLALGAALAVLALALLTIKILNAATRLALGIAAGIGLAVVGIIAVQTAPISTLIDVDVAADLVARSISQGSESPPPAVPARPSAATSITLFLLAVIVFLGLAAGGSLLGWQWWKQRQKRQRLEAMALVYGAMNGALPAPRRARAHLGQGQPGVYVVTGQQPQPQPEPLPGWEVRR